MIEQEAREFRKSGFPAFLLFADGESMSEGGEIPAYRVIENADLFEVRSPSGVCILACRDLSSAEQYALMLSEAYRLGYKHAVREKR